MPKFKKIKTKKDNSGVKRVLVYSMENFQNILLRAATEAGRGIIARNPGLLKTIESATTKEDFKRISNEIII